MVGGHDNDPGGDVGQPNGRFYFVAMLSARTARPEGLNGGFPLEPVTVGVRKHVESGESCSPERVGHRIIGLPRQLLLFSLIVGHILSGCCLLCEFRDRTD